MEAARLQLLQTMPVFGGATEASLEFLFQRARLLQLKRGEVIFHQGETADAMYVIELGSVAVYRDQFGEELLVRTLNQGDCFGEMSLVDYYPRSCSVIATGPCTIIEISQKSLFELYHENLQEFVLIQMNIAREISRRLRLTDERLFGDQVSHHF